MYSHLLCFYFTLLCDWLTKLAPLFQPMRSKTKTNRELHARAFSRAWRRLHVITSNSDWFTELSVSLVIGQSSCLGFGFTTLD